jgi:hypothetical protein
MIRTQHDSGGVTERWIYGGDEPIYHVFHPLLCFLSIHFAVLFSRERCRASVMVAINNDRMGNRIREIEHSSTNIIEFMVSLEKKRNQRGNKNKEG